jgi:hypothetical protein
LPDARITAHILRVLHGCQSVLGAHTLPNPSAVYVFLAEWGSSDRLRFTLEQPQVRYAFPIPRTSGAL